MRGERRVLLRDKGLQGLRTKHDLYIYKNIFTSCWRNAAPFTALEWGEKWAGVKHVKMTITNANSKKRQETTIKVQYPSSTILLPHDPFPRLLFLYKV
jgi:hypothetical protein